MAKRNQSMDPQMSNGRSSDSSSQRHLNGQARESSERSTAIRIVDGIYRDRAKSALAADGMDVLELLSDRPGVSTVELARLLDRNSNAIGLIIAAFEAAEADGTVRQVAMDLLTRKILERFPKGWTTKTEIHPAVNLVGWVTSVKNYTTNPQNANYARQIANSLVTTDSPAEGWKPELQNDPLLESVFNIHWPA